MEVWTCLLILPFLGYLCRARTSRRPYYAYEASAYQGVHSRGDGLSSPCTPTYKYPCSLYTKGYRLLFHHGMMCKYATTPTCSTSVYTMQRTKEQWGKRYWHAFCVPHSS